MKVNIKSEHVSDTTSLKDKVLCVVLGLIAVFIVLEIGLRFAGWAYLHVQEKYNATSPGEYRIMCIGESTTGLGGVNSYPRQLEMILNDRYPNRYFNVINKGRSGLQSGDIIMLVNDYMSRYNPDMVVIMMGINDAIYYGTKPMTAARDFKARYIDRLRTYRLLNLIRLHIPYRMEEIAKWFAQKREKFLGGEKSHVDSAKQEVPFKKPIVIDEGEAENDYERYIFLERYHPITVRNYNDIIDMFLDRGVTVICMQYPNRSITPLREVLKERDRIIFVENPDNFSKALARHSPQKYFGDMFARKFGHCTRAGNYLIADNLADHIIAYLEKQKEKNAN